MNIESEDVVERQLVLFGAVALTFVLFEVISRCGGGTEAAHHMVMMNHIANLRNTNMIPL